MSKPAAGTETLVVTEQMTHTPGPWKARALKNGNVIVFAELSQLALGICHILFTNGQPHENARLIAAAPEMLAALREIQVIAEGHVIDLAAQAQEGGPIARMELTRWSSVLAAIAKAEGTAS